MAEPILLKAKSISPVAEPILLEDKPISPVAESISLEAESTFLRGEPFAGSGETTPNTRGRSRIIRMFGGLGMIVAAVRSTRRSY